jgi:hypothetical protein
VQVIHHVERQPPVRVTEPFSQRLDLAALRYELVAFTSLWISQTDPAS